MTNNAYHKLCHEFNLNYNYQNNFREYCDNIGIMKKNFYGNTGAKTEDMKAARDYWKKNHKLWLKNSEEVDVYIDNMPFGDYPSELDAHKVLQNFRKKRN